MKECLFCRIVAREEPANVVTETASALAFRDISPEAPCHILVIPKKHIATLDQASPADQELLGHLMLLAQEVARAENVALAYRVVINNGAEAGQSIFHIHAHLLAGRQLAWPPG